MAHIYRETAQVLEEFHQKKGSLRGLIFQTTIKHKENVYALAVETLKYWDVIKHVLTTVGLFKNKQIALKMWKVYPMVHDLLFNKRIIGAGNLRKMIMKYSTQMKAELVKLKVKRKAQSNDELLPPEYRNPIELPRYVRVNTLKAKVEDVLAKLQEGDVSELVSDKTKQWMEKKMDKKKVAKERREREKLKKALAAEEAAKKKGRKGKKGKKGKKAQKGEPPAKRAKKESKKQDDKDDESEEAETSSSEEEGSDSEGENAGANDDSSDSGDENSSSDDKENENDAHEGGDNPLDIPRLKRLYNPWTEAKLDEHLPDVLVLPRCRNRGLIRHPLVIDGSIILQDKASCFSAHALSPPEGSHVIDCCAAPGNKTSHLAALMNGKGKIFAFDLDRYRFQTLKRLGGRAGIAKMASFFNQNFLRTDPNDPQFAEVEYILADPSCSGSGIVSRFPNFSTTPDELEWLYLGSNNKEKTARLKALSDYQKAIIDHALKFPRVKRVVYSTCSIFEEENEQVVKAILDSHPEVRLVRALPQWPRRGNPIFPGAENCVRTVPEEDKTIGFFVACFEVTSRAGANDEDKKNVVPKTEQGVGASTQVSIKQESSEDNATKHADKSQTSGSSKKKRKREDKSGDQKPAAPVKKEKAEDPSGKGDQGEQSSSSSKKKRKREELSTPEKKSTATATTEKESSTSDGAKESKKQKNKKKKKKAKKAKGEKGKSK